MLVLGSTQFVIVLPITHKHFVYVWALAEGSQIIKPICQEYAPRKQPRCIYASHTNKVVLLADIRNTTLGDIMLNPHYTSKVVFLPIQEAFSSCIVFCNS